MKRDELQQVGRYESFAEAMHAAHVAWTKLPDELEAIGDKLEAECGSARPR